MTDRTCPACDEPVEDVCQVGPITLELDPCGHQVDEKVYVDHVIDE